ncbi:MAG: ABC transporter ATP-binding protein [Hyphomicrobiaceae bacterium]|nr:ABC transporter ATP-binding protein [Hyphomicrobiaceae bacterium]
MLELADVTKLYNQGRPNEVAAVRGVTLDIEAGKVTVLTGPSGSGKTTLLTLIGCLARPTTGRVRLNGEILSGLPEKFLADVRRRTFGFAFQRFNLIAGLSALDNVMLPAYPLGPPHRRLTARAMEMLANLGVDHRAATAVENLSGGEMQRVAIARALVNDPAIVIADEPTANLDGALVGQFLDIVATLKARGKTVLMTSHDGRISGAPVVDRVVAVADGRIAEAAA